MAREAQLFFQRDQCPQFPAWQGVPRSAQHVLGSTPCCPLGTLTVLSTKEPALQVYPHPTDIPASQPLPKPFHLLLLPPAPSKSCRLLPPGSLPDGSSLSWSPLLKHQLAGPPHALPHGHHSDHVMSTCYMLAPRSARSPVTRFLPQHSPVW